MQHKILILDELKQAIPKNHKYRNLKEKMQKVITELNLQNNHAFWMLILQAVEKLSTFDLLENLQVNFLMRWFCDYILNDEIMSEDEFIKYKQSISAYMLTKIIKCLLEDNYSTDEFVEIMNIVLDESPNILTRHNCDNSFIILVSQKSKQLVEAIERDKKLVLQCVKHEGNLQYTIVCGNEEEVKNVIGQMKNIAIGAGTGHEWKAAFALSYTAYQQLLLLGQKKLIFQHQETPLTIINLILSEKRLALENSMKESNLEQAYAQFENIVDCLNKHAKKLHWIQIRHELLKLFCAICNGGFHYHQSAEFGVVYIKILESLLTSSLEEAVNNMRELLHSCNISEFQSVITTEYSYYTTAARKLIDSDYATDLRLSEVARKLGITPEYLSSIFKKVHGRNFSEYLTDIRIKNACCFLTKEIYKISEVATMVGFESVDYFGKVFKRKMNMTPRQYKKAKTESH